MVYLVGQALFLLLLTYLVGMLFGWLLRKALVRTSPTAEQDKRDIASMRAERTRLRREIADLRERNESAGERIAALEADLEASRAAAPILDGEASDDPTETPDDLTQIFGIGPYINSKLAQLGITSYQQVALMDDEKIEYVGRHIGYFPDRIRREDWPGVAASLYRAKYGEDVPEAEEAAS